MNFLSCLLAACMLMASGCRGIDPAPPAELLTVAESSDYRATACHAEVVALLDRLAAADPSIARRASMGLSGEGREIPLLILADPPVADAASARAPSRQGHERLVVLMLGNIHAGEVDGKEALPILARDILLARRRPFLDRLVIVFAPIYNADGNERVSRDNRSTQNGPEEGMGVRENAAGLDLNRDFIKADAPETRALIAFLNAWDPAIVLDTHVTNGSLHRYLITYAGPKAPAGDRALIEHARRVMLPDIARRFRRDTRWQAFWYGNFEGAFGEAPRGRSRWETFPAEARFGTTYVGLRGRLGILVESYSYAPYRERVLATHAFVRACLRHAAESAEDIRRLIRAVDERAVRNGAEPHQADPIALRTRAAPAGLVRVASYEDPPQGWRPGRDPLPPERDYDVELWDRFEATRSIALPYAYLLPPSLTPVIEALTIHGVRLDVLMRPVELGVGVQRIDRATSASRLFQGRVLVAIDATERSEVRAFDAGTVVVHTSQPLGRLAAYLLEPQCEDGLGAWNFLGEHTRPGADWPIVRVVEPADLPTRTWRE